MGLPTDDAGHTIGKNLGGRGGKKYVFPQNANRNRGEFNQFEQQIVDRVKSTGRPVDIEQVYNYGNGGTRPTHIEYNVYDNGVKIMGKIFQNPF